MPDSESSILRQAFPDLGLLKAMIARREGAAQGWPTVVLNATQKEVYRPDVKGPLSIFLNLRGESFCGVHGQRVRIPEGSYYLTNEGEHYTLELDSQTPVETFNIHFGHRMAEGVYSSLATPADKVLEGSDRRFPVHFFNKLNPTGPQLMQLLLALKRAHNDVLLRDEALYRILVYLLHRHREALKETERLPQLKHHVKTEIYRRLSQSVDYMHTRQEDELSLDELAAIACLSKFHYLRLFKALYGLTPHQYLTRLRIRRSQELLAQTRLPVWAVAEAAGYKDASAFSRAFYGQVGVWPQAYRAQV